MGDFKLAAEPRNRRGRPTVETAATDLVTLARLRYPVENSTRRVGDIVGAGLPWGDPEPTIRNLIWDERGGLLLERMILIIRSLVSNQSRDKISTATLR